MVEAPKILVAHDQHVQGAHSDCNAGHEEDFLFHRLRYSARPHGFQVIVDAVTLPVFNPLRMHVDGTEVLAIFLGCQAIAHVVDCHVEAHSARQSRGRQREFRRGWSR